MAWFSVTVPKGWKRRFTRGCLQLSLPKLAPGDEYTFQLCQFDKPLDVIAEQELFFERDDRGQWLRTAGKAPPSPVSALKTKAWSGLIVEQPCGVHDENGPHTGDCLTGAVSDGARTVAFDSTGTFTDLEALRRIVKTLAWR